MQQETFENEIAYIKYPKHKEVLDNNNLKKPFPNNLEIQMFTFNIMMCHFIN